MFQLAIPKLMSGLIRRLFLDARPPKQKSQYIS